MERAAAQEGFKRSGALSRNLDNSERKKTKENKENGGKPQSRSTAAGYHETETAYHDYIPAAESTRRLSGVNDTAHQVTSM